MLKDADGCQGIMVMLCYASESLDSFIDNKSSVKSQTRTRITREKGTHLRYRRISRICGTHRAYAKCVRGISEGKLYHPRGFPAAGQAEGFLYASSQSICMNS